MWLKRKQLKTAGKGLLGYGTGVDLAAGFAAVPLLGSLMGGR
jgi:hypothetical protein